MGKILNEFINIVKQKYSSQIVHIFLFGSYSRGEETPSSDIDILVIWKGNRQEGWENIENIAYNFLLDKGKYISVKVITVEEKKKMEKLHNPFIENINREGIILV